MNEFCVICSEPVYDADSLYCETCLDYMADDFDDDDATYCTNCGAAFTEDEYVSSLLQRTND